jgi:23S rRNA pseudouridine955/2504/2580 synthase
MNALAATADAESGAAAPRAPDVRLVRVDDEHAGQRLDNFLLARLKGVPKSHVYRIVRSGEVRVNRGRVGPDHRLAEGDVVRIPPVRTAAPPPAARPARRVAGPGPFPILHEDDDLLVIDKPSGVAVHGGSGVSFGVIEQLRAARPEARRLELVHRLDRETSGVLLIARRRSALAALHDAMRAGRIRKRYLAIVAGRWQGPARALRFPLHKFVTPEGERRVVVRDGGQPAGTRVRLLRALQHPTVGPLSLVQADLETGRTHQIRVHLAHVGHPLLGDDRYGLFELNKLLDKEGHKRLMLHALSVDFEHPGDGRPTHVEAPPPASFRALLEACRDAV